jgi:hypothetical protein
MRVSSPAARPLGVVVTLISLGTIACACKHGGGPDRSQTLSDPAGGVRGRITRTDFFECFPLGTKAADGNEATCETSAIVFDGRDVIVANDKPRGGGHSDVFKLGFAAGDLVRAPLEELMAPALLAAKKYEDFALAPDGETVFATTGFDRFDARNHAKDAYNVLLSWPAGAPQAAALIGESVAEGIASSVGLRAKLAAALNAHAARNDLTYFKVEGLAAIPGDRLLFGIREAGQHFSRFEYTIRIVSVGYGLDDGRVVLGDDFRVVYDQPTAPLNAQVGKSVGLSSIEYDRFNDRVYLLTSYEQNPVGREQGDEDIGAFLWTLPLAAFDGAPGPAVAPALVRDQGGLPLVFAHKAEDLTPIDARHLLVIHDDDRVTGRPTVTDPRTQFATRTQNQGYYSLVELD